MVYFFYLASHEANQIGTGFTRGHSEIFKTKESVDHNHYNCWPGIVFYIVRYRLPSGNYALRLTAPFRPFVATRSSNQFFLIFNPVIYCWRN